MSAPQAFLQIVKSIWDGFFALTSPFFGLTFKQIFIGLFVVLVSIRLLWDLLGLGSAVVNDVTSLGTQGLRSARSSFKNRKVRSSPVSTPEEFTRSVNKHGNGVRRSSSGSKPLGGKKRNL